MPIDAIQLKFPDTTVRVLDSRDAKRLADRLALLSAPGAGTAAGKIAEELRHSPNLRNPVALSEPQAAAVREVMEKHGT